MSASVFGKTIWERRLSILSWVTFSAAITLVLAAFYPSLRDNAALSELLDRLPAAMVSTLGIDPARFQTGAGYIDGELYSLVAPIIVVAFAVSMGAGATAAEEERGTMEQLLSLPIRRERLVVEKLAAQAALIAVLAATFTGALALGDRVFDLGLWRGGILAVNLGLALLGLLFGTAAAAAGAWRGSVAWAQAVGGGLALAMFLFNGLAPLVPGLEGLERITPFHWYQGDDPLLDGFSPWFLLLAGGSVALGLAAMVLFRHRDTAVQRPVLLPRRVRTTRRRPSPLLRTVVGAAVWKRRRSILGWIAALAILAGLVMTLYPTIRSDQPDSLQQVIESVPPELLALFGITDPGSLLTGAGFVSSRVYGSVGMIVVLVFAIGMGVDLAREDHDGIADLLLSGSVTRRRLVVERSAAMVGVLGFVMALLGLVVLAGNAVIDLDLTVEGIVAANVGLGLLALVFGALAMMVGAWRGRPSLAAAVAGGLALFSFFLNGLGAVIDFLEPFRAGSPFRWYLGDSTPLATGFSGSFWLLGLAAAGFFGAAVVLFERRDLGT